MLEELGIKIRNEKLKKAIQEYSLHFLSPIKEIDFTEIDTEIATYLKNSPVIIIDQFQNPDEESDKYFAICFKKTLIVIKQPIVSFIIHLFLKINDKIEFCFLHDTKKAFNENIKIKYKESYNNNFLQDELDIFKKCFHILHLKKDLLSKKCKIICTCLSAYFIKNGYSKSNINRVTDFNAKKDKTIYERTINDDDYIELRNIGGGSTSIIKLIYHIEDESLYVIKKAIGDQEFDKLNKREFNNYKNIINHPFLPKFIGITTRNQYLVFEYINGQTLLDSDISNYSEAEIFSIIIQILSVFQYFHANHYIYRDLKPNNIMIDTNKIAVLIDFDRMINENEIINVKEEDDHKNNSTNDFADEFVAPETNLGKFSNKCDIYSIGKLIIYILKKCNSNYLNNYPQINNMIRQCCDVKEGRRPDVSEIIHFFYSVLINKNIILTNVNKNNQFELGDYYIKINKINEAIKCYIIAAKQNYPPAQYNLGAIYSEGKYIERDINKAIYFFSLAVNQNYPPAQNNLGVIYYEGKYTKRDINKAIYFFSLAASQNLSDAQYNLGYIYLEGKCIQRDINKAIYYLTLAANQDHLKAQMNIGLIYYEGKYIPQNINKSIHYFTLAANQNDLNAQVNLGLIYYEGKYTQRDINKAFHYFSLAANQNDPEAQFYLGLIYFISKRTQQEIDKAIHYYSLAANQNHPYAQFNLGNLYYKGQYVIRNINKAIYYYSLAANQNFPQAQNNLGLIYHEGKYTQRDINKAIHYYLLAANQNDLEALINLGTIYYDGKYVSRDIKKSIHYFSLAANQNSPQAQFNLGTIYFEGIYISQNINKAIQYYSLAANQNHSDAQYNLGFIYYDILNETRKNINLGIFWILESSERGNIHACFFIGFLYQEGKYIDKDIKKSIHNYKEASSFNNQYAKNNLGIINKHGIDNEIGKNNGIAEIYFIESINKKNDRVSMYNLAHLYIYEYGTAEFIDKSINLLIDSLNLKFYQSAILLVIILFKKYDRNIEKVKKDLSRVNEKVYNHSINGLNMSIFLDENILEVNYQFYKNIDFLYNQSLNVIETNHLYDFKKNHKTQTINQKKDISQDFYDGFVCDC